MNSRRLDCSVTAHVKVKLIFSKNKLVAWRYMFFCRNSIVKMSA